MGRALKIAVPLLAVALLILPIPGVHLASPVLVVFAIMLGARRLREVERICALEGHCACDRGPQIYELPARPTLPLTLRCPGCADFVKVEAS